MAAEVLAGGVSAQAPSQGARAGVPRVPGCLTNRARGQACLLSSLGVGHCSSTAVLCRAVESTRPYQPGSLCRQVEPRGTLALEMRRPGRDVPDGGEEGVAAPDSAAQPRPQSPCPPSTAENSIAHGAGAQWEPGLAPRTASDQRGAGPPASASLSLPLALGCGSPLIPGPARHKDRRRATMALLRSDPPVGSLSLKGNLALEMASTAVPLAPHTCLLLCPPPPPHRSRTPAPALPRAPGPYPGSGTSHLRSLSRISAPRPRAQPSTGPSRYTVRDWDG